MVFPISDLAPETMWRILDFMYTGSMVLNESNVQETMLAADKYIMGAVQACYKFLRGAELNCIGIWKFTNVCYHIELSNKALCCILEAGALRQGGSLQ